MATSAALVERAVPPPPGATSALAAARADAGEEHVGDRAVHRLGHLLGEDRAGGADEHAGDDQRRVVERDARRGRGQAGEGVQGARSRPACRRRRSARPRARRARPRRAGSARTAARTPSPRRSPPPARPAISQQRAVDHLAASRIAPFISSCSFRKAMFEPQKEIEPMIAANSIGISSSSGRSPRAARNSTTRDQRHRAAADAVEQRHHLRHRGHLHAARGRARRRRRRSPRRARSAASRRRPAAAASRRPRSPCRPPRSGCRAPPCAARAASAAPMMNIEKATM